MGADQARDRAWHRLPLLGGHAGAGLLVTVSLIMGALWLRMTLDGVLTQGFPFVTFFPVVVFAAVVFGTWHGALAAMLGGLLSWYFFVPPLRSWALEPASLAALGLYAFTASAIVLAFGLAAAGHARLAAERARSDALAENRELLFRELQHRVSNNLQVISSLLALQKRGVREPAAVTALEQASNRLALVGRIQRQLYDMAGTRVGLAALLKDLARGTLEASGRRDIELAVDADPDIDLEPDATIPLALVVTEAVSNAVEHGLAGRGGRIVLRLARAEDGQLSVTVADDGAGLPPGFELERTDSLGLRIARNLAKQLGGTFSLRAGHPGAVARLSLPAGA